MDVSDRSKMDMSEKEVRDQLAIYGFKEMYRVLMEFEGYYGKSGPKVRIRLFKGTNGQFHVEADEMTDGQNPKSAQSTSAPSMQTALAITKFQVFD